MTSASISSTTSHHRRAGLLGVAVTALLVVATAWTVRETIRSWTAAAGRPATAPADALPIVLWAAASLALLWATVLVLPATADLFRRAGAVPANRARPRRSTPPGARRVAAVLLLVTGAWWSHSAALAAPAAPAPVTVTHQDPTGAATGLSWSRALPVPDLDGPADECSAPADTGAAEPGALPSPGWQASAPMPVDQCAVDSTPLVTGSSHAADQVVVVHRGDSLWTLVARHLGPDADATTIARVWPTWYAANRSVIGSDPNHLLPGEVLQVPSARAGA